jgi:hypothetical protein
MPMYGIAPVKGTRPQGNGPRRAPGGRRGNLRRRLLPLVATLVAAVVLGACGSSGAGAGGTAAAPTASQAPDSTPPAADSTAPAAQGTAQSGPPTSHYILMCSVQAAGTTSSGTPGTLTWLDPTTLQVLYQETIIAPLLGPTVVPVGEINSNGFAETPTPAASTATPALSSPGGGCGGWQLSADQTSIAGINVVGNSAVPATFNLASGAITNVVQPPSTSGFAATAPVTYIGAFYAPDGHSVWSLQCDGTDDDLTVHAPDGKVEANIPSTITDGGGVPLCDNTTMSDSYLIWLPGASTPTVVIEDASSSGSPYPYNLAALSLTPGGTDSPLAAAQAASLPLVDQSLLPQSNWTFGYIHRSSDGSRAAFIAQNNTTHAWALFTMDGDGKNTPHQVNATLPGCSTTCGDVLAYNP